jgi:hypothetical protein
MKVRWNTITPIESELVSYGYINPNIFSQTKAATYDSRVASLRQNSNVVIYHEGKTPGSVLWGLVYAHGYALLVCIRVYDAKKNPGGRTRYPGNHWNLFFVSPKCDKEWVWPVSRIQVQGDWIWSRWQVFALAVNWPLDPSELSGLFIKTPCEIS